MEKNLFSPSMLKKYLSCKYIIFNEVNEKKLGLVKREQTISDVLRFEKGDEHEKDYFKILEKKYSKVIDLKNLKRDEKLKKTLECMKEGYEVIRGGYLQFDEWIGEFDFLEINKQLKSKLGNYSYEVIDTKNSSKVKPDHIFQVCTYCYLLEKVQGVLPNNFYIILKNMIKETVRVNTVYDFFLKNFEKYEKFIKQDIEKTKPEKCNFCEICNWSDECEKIWTKEDNLNQLPNAHKAHRKKFIKAGYKTISSLAKLDVKAQIEGIRPEVSQRFIINAKLKKEKEKLGKPVYQINEENLKYEKGFNLLPKPTENDLFFDIESVQDYVVEGKLEYLFGIYYYEKGQEKFKALWAHDREQEKKNVIDFFEFTEKHFEKYPDAKIYHYASYEITALERLTSFHKVKHIEYDHYLHLGKFVDLLAVTRQGLFVSDSYSIKDIEKFYDFKRTGAVKKGDVSEHFYIEWMNTKDQTLLDAIEDYNKQDCKSTYLLREWLVSKKPSNTYWFKPSKEEKEYSEKEIKMLQYRNNIEGWKSKDENLKQIISDVVGFYNREDKPDWREFFDRKNCTHDELVDDIECIGDMKLIKPPVKEDRSLVYTYSFDEQEFKLKAGEACTVANNLVMDEDDYGGKIVDIDHINRIVILKKGTAGRKGKIASVLKDNISIGPKKPHNVSNLEASTYRFVDSCLNNENNFNVVKEILTKQKPRIKGIKTGDKIVKTENFIREIPKIIANLDNSYLYIQGPPGTGKTTQAANAIVELIKKKMKIGVTANSHKVIHNLLSKVESEARRHEVVFKGLKRGDPEDDNSNFEGDFIKTYKNDKNFIGALIDKESFVFGGTKFHFSSAYYRENLDYLFIDEAGQLSLADLVAIGGAAKNIVLIGDQNQLGTPIRGSHPGESGKSILDFLLQGSETIPDDTGIFLSKTYRLNEPINDFISNNFYDHRLVIDEKNKNRKIIYNKKGIIRDEGIHYLEMSHEDNLQTSEEECDVIKELIREFVGLEFIDENKKSRKLTLDDILIISPYNAQVNFLLSRLNKGSKVGTIDKFQGQQAPITIISMTSSDAESLPKNRRFFFNKNRLNVAISRSQCVSIILLNPKLLEISPTTDEQVKLLNNYCKILSYRS